MSERPLENILEGRCTRIEPTAVHCFVVRCEILTAVRVLVTVFLDVITGTSCVRLSMFKRYILLPSSGYVSSKVSKLLLDYTTLSQKTVSNLH
jgi:hypothetical protein